MVNTDEAPPLYPLSDTNRAALVVVTSLVFFIYALLGVVAKIVIRFKITFIKSHDVLLLIAIVLYFIQTVCVINACNAGLGQHIDQLDQPTIHRFYQVSRRLSLA